MKGFKLIRTLILIITIGCSQQPRDTSINSESKSNEESSSVNTAKQTLECTVSLTMLDENGHTIALGSGTVIGTGQVVTNFHVIQGASNGYVQFSSIGEKHKIEGLLALDESNDLALLSIPTLKNEGLKLQVKIPNVGEKIFAAGNPHGLSGTFSDGIVSSIRNFGNKKLIQITAPISPGSSGGPIVNSSSELLGIAVGGFTNGQNLNFIIPAEYVNNLLQNKNQLFSLKVPISKKKSSNNDLEVHLSKKVLIRNLRWGVTREISAEGDQDCKYLTDLSILNSLDKPVCNVKLLFIMYDGEGIPVDYEICSFSTDRNAILPNLAKTFNTGIVNGCRNLMKYSGYKLEIRVLDFDILN